VSVLIITLNKQITWHDSKSVINKYSENGHLSLGYAMMQCEEASAVLPESGLLNTETQSYTHLTLSQPSHPFTTAKVEFTSKPPLKDLLAPRHAL
jgi:hypothetical protein